MNDKQADINEKLKMIQAICKLHFEWNYNLFIGRSALDRLVVAINDLAGQAMFCQLLDDEAE